MSGTRIRSTLGLLLMNPSSTLLNTHVFCQVSVLEVRMMSKKCSKILVQKELYK